MRHSGNGGHLTEHEQTQLKSVLDINEFAPSLSQASRLKKYIKDRKLHTNLIDTIMSEEKAIESKLVEVQKTIIKLLEDWQTAETTFHSC